VALDCVSWTQAQAYCQSKGKDLATWLQFEYVAGDLTSQLYPWGRDEPACSDAVFGRNVANAGTSSSQCAEADTPYGPVAPRSGARDHVDLPGGSLYDLAGNVSEWVKDYGSSSEPCSTSNLLVDFVCTDSTSTMGARVAKGGAWFNQPASLRAADAIAGPPTTTANGVGFRCARPAAP
jgi:iron(II)-dependent oxidoreductase